MASAIVMGSPGARRQRPLSKQVPANSVGIGAGRTRRGDRRSGACDPKPARFYTQPRPGKARWRFART